MQWEIIIVMFVYLAAMFLIGVWSARETVKAKGGFIEQYFLGGRGMGGFILAMTLTTTYISAGSFIAGPGMAYSMGLGWVLLSMSQLPVGYLVLGVLGKRFAIVARKIHAVTIIDFLKERYQSKTVVILSAIGILLFFLAAISVQFIGGARLFESMTGLPYQTALFVFAGVVIGYVTIGGFRAVVLTDTAQGIVMFVGTVILIAGVFMYGGGVRPIMDKLMAINPDLITPYGVKSFITVPWIVSFWILVGFGVIGLPQVAVRGMAYKSSKAMHNAIIIGTIFTGFLMLGMHLVGAVGQAILPNIKVADTVIPEITKTTLNPWLAGIFLTAPLAAIMSTVSSQLLVLSSTICKDLYINYINPNPNEAFVRKLSFFITALAGLTVFLLSYNPPDFLVWLNLFALAGMETVFLWPTLLGLYWKRANDAGAISSILVGVSSYLYCHYYWSRPFGAHTIILPLILALVVFIVVSLMTRPPRPETIRKFWG
ncbi:sodium/pantothenate symporter [Anaerosporomusa subterranea]|uniref:Sodium/pantothenate symporter n=1 Tax=Anaerosporomusa subterranea TaxID=1794912 RepID=A0A154BWV8_ANASB|nr:sodium/pantothenate symporter [Anaerosporomusa subterranea]KYZ78280.1 sodium/pantothenate symporter [Anaerosporomusa subterranea]